MAVQFIFRSKSLQRLFLLSASHFFPSSLSGQRLSPTHTPTTQRLFLLSATHSAPIKYRHLYTTPYTPEKTNIPLKNRKVKSTIPIRALDDEETEKPNISDKTGAFTSQVTLFLLYNFPIHVKFTIFLLWVTLYLAIFA